MTGVVSINHYDTVARLATICLICLILFQDYVFNKLQSNSALRVSLQGNMGVRGTSSKCNRETWGSLVMTSAIAGISSLTEMNAVDQWRLRLLFTTTGHLGTLIWCIIGHFDGYCENIPQGAVRVELWVGQCSSGHALGDAHTGWSSVSRLIIEEVSSPQSY